MKVNGDFRVSGNNFCHEKSKQEEYHEFTKSFKQRPRIKKSGK